MKAKVKGKIKVLAGTKISVGSVVEVKQQKSGLYSIIFNGQEAIIDIRPEKFEIIK